LGDLNTAVKIDHTQLDKVVGAVGKKASKGPGLQLLDGTLASPQHRPNQILETLLTYFQEKV